LNGLLDNDIKYEYTPGQKVPYFSDVEEIQKGLQILGHSLPKSGVDGKFGQETEEATKKFQEKNNMTQTGVFGKEEIKALIENLISQNFEDSDLLKYMNESLIDLQENTRRISHNLMPTMLEQHGFSVAIENYFENLNRAEGVTFDFQNKTEVLTVSKQIEYDLFRVIQEFTVNMLKYGKITHCVVILFELQGRIALELIDDGVTFDYKTKYLQGKGLGLQNIQSRLNSMNAVLEQKISLTGNHFLIHLK
jgi:signal transduction histidine kinase